MKFFTGTDSQAYLAEKTGYMPNSTSASKHPDLVKYYAANPHWKVAIDQLQFVQPQASVISLPKGTEILRQMVEKLLIANMDVNTVMAETKADLKRVQREFQVDDVLGLMAAFAAINHARASMQKPTGISHVDCMSSRALLHVLPVV